MNWPLCPVALLFAGGILLGQCVHPPLQCLFAVSFAAALAAIFFGRARVTALHLLLVLAGWTNLACHTAIISPNDLRRILGPAPDLVAVRGRLRDSPVARIYERQGRENWRSAVMIDAKEIRLGGQWRPAFGKIIATAPGLLDSNFFTGQNVDVTGAIAPPSGPLAEGLFDPRSHYQHLGVYYQLRTSSMDAWAVVPATPPLTMPISDRFSTWAKKTLALGLGPEDGPLHLIWTLALDWKAPLTQTVEEPFMRAGTYHIFAVDGLRIGLLAGMGLALLRVLRLPRAWCGLLTLPLIWFYVGLTGWPASAVRAAIMTSIVIAGWAAHRPVDLLNSLFAAAFIILVWDPAQLFQPGFQLSFMVVFCIALILPLIRELFRKWVFAPDPFLPARLAPRWPPALHAAVCFAIDAAALSLAAWLGSIPLAAVYFHLFTPVSVAANFFVVPVTALALMGGLGSLLTGAWLPGVAMLFNHASWFFMNCIIALSRWAAKCPGGAFHVSAPSPALFALYYLVLFSLLGGWLKRPRIRWPAAGAALILAVCWLAGRASELGIANLHFLPLNGGHAVFAEGPGSGDNFLFDCGDASAAESVVKPFLAAHGVNRLDAFALTAGHVRDGGGAEVILTNFSSKIVFLNALRDRSPAYRDVIDTVKQSAHWRELRDGAEAAGWTALHPGPGPRFDDADDNALVFRREINGQSILLLSCLGRAGQDDLIAAHPNLHADIVVSALPAQDEPLCEPLLDLLQPKLIIIIDSATPATRRASAKLRDRLATRHIPVIYCRDTGGLKLTLRRSGWELHNPESQSVGVSTNSVFATSAANP